LTCPTGTNTTSSISVSHYPIQWDKPWRRDTVVIASPRRIEDPVSNPARV
jgi:hypothetical protein